MKLSSIKVVAIAVVCNAAMSFSASALTLSSAELAASQLLGCVLADDALGYLTEDQFNDRFDETVEDFSDEQVDVIYAKALGYIDGLLFGVSSGDASEASRRLLTYSSSETCAAGARYANHTVSL